MITNGRSADYFFKRTWLRMNRLNKNWLAIICGETGSGKSYTALSIASRLGRVFVVFTPMEFLELINSKTLQKGDIVVFDEAGVGMSSRDWYTVQNKLLGSVLQTFRNMNIGVIFTTPNLSFIDVQARKLFHNYMETAFIDRTKDLCLVRVYDIQVNSRLDKTYFKHPLIKLGGRTNKLRSLWIERPSNKVCDMYEEKKTKYTEDLNAKALEDLRGQNKPVRETIDEASIVKDILSKKDRFIVKWRDKNIVRSGDIQSEYSVGGRISERIKRTVENSI